MNHIDMYILNLIEKVLQILQNLIIFLQYTIHGIVENNRLYNITIVCVKIKY